MLSEEGPAELATAALYAVSAAMALALAFRTRETVPGPYRALYALFALGALFVALEEVSYGQHVFGWDSPRWFAEHNVKGEVNLHNLYGDRPTRALRNLALVGYSAVGIVLPLAGPGAGTLSPGRPWVWASSARGSGSCRSSSSCRTSTAAAGRRAASRGPSGGTRAGCSGPSA
jgi:hypothetical protein